MRDHDTKLRGANVVSGFENQDLAEEAVLELRLAGFRDRRIGFYHQAGRGRMADFLRGRHRFAATVLWGLLGAAIGAALVPLLDQMWPEGPDRVGLAATLGTCGALALGTAGGMLGLRADPSDEDVPAPAGPEVPYLVAVDAGEARDRVREILTRRGGREIATRRSAAAPSARLLV